MGYILPVNNYQGQEYQRRVTSKKTDPFYIETPYKTILSQHYMDMDKDEEHKHQQAKYLPLDILKQFHDGVSLPPHEQMDAHMIENITGKGQYFSERI